MKNKDILSKIKEIDTIKENIDLTSEKVTMGDGKTLQKSFDELRDYVMQIETGARFT